MPPLALENLPRTRAAAIALGVGRYFTGKPCKRGHVEARHIAGMCLACGREKQAKRLESPEFLARHSAWSLARYHRKRAEPGFLENIRKNARRASRAPERRQKQAEYDKRTYPDRKPRMRATAKDLYHRKKDQPEFKAKVAVASREYRLRNPDKCRARCKGYQERKRGAAPPWLTVEDLRAMESVYAEAQRRTEETGVPHEVDHIYPLNGVASCGLHVPWNLQVLPAAENRSKSNMTPEHVPFYL